MKFPVAVFVALLSLPSGAADTAVSTVQTLYRDFAWETVIAEPSAPGLIDQPRNVLAKYFDEQLTTLLLEDRQCARTTHETCHLEFMPLWDAQDIGATDLAIRATRDPSKVEVTFRFAGTKDKKKLTYQLVHSAAGWRISDIRSPAWSLAEILKRNP